MSFTSSGVANMAGLPPKFKKQLIEHMSEMSTLKSSVADAYTMGVSTISSDDDYSSSSSPYVPTYNHELCLIDNDGGTVYMPSTDMSTYAGRRVTFINVGSSSVPISFVADNGAGGYTSYYYSLTIAASNEAAFADFYCDGEMWYKGYSSNTSGALR